MINEIERMIDKSKHQLEFYETVLGKIEKEPLLILDKLFNERTVNNLLSFLMFSEGEECLLKFQNYIYELLIPKLKLFLNIDDLEFSYDSDVYNSPITVKLYEIPIIELFVFEKILVLKLNSKSQQILEQIKTLHLEHNDLILELEDLELKKINPLLLLENNPLKLISSVVNKKAIEENLNDKIVELNSKLISKEKLLNSLYIKLDVVDRDYLYIQDVQDKIRCIIENRYDYNVFKEEICIIN